MMKSLILLSFLVVRILSIFIVETFFVPDEFWQVVEVAHKLVFRYGHLTWEWREGIRSSFYPMIFAALFKILQILKMDTPLLIVNVPRIAQAVLSSCGDLFTFQLSKKLHGTSSAHWTWFCIISSWFLFYCSSRTLINVTDMALTSVGFYFYPWTSKRFKVTSVTYLIWGAASCLLRPTAVVTWLPLFLWQLSRLNKTSLLSVFCKTLFILVVSLTILVVSDYIFYGKWLFSPWNFYHWNWTLNIGEFYGKHPWHWYFSQGLPAVLSGHLVFFLVGLRKKQLRSLYFLVLYFMVILSLVPHKEFRFLLPILPVILIICGNSLTSLCRHFDSVLVTRCLMLFLLVTNVPLAVYVSQWHQRGQMDVMPFLRSQVQSSSNISVLFLMPCHSTPYYSHLHSPVPMDFLTCEPKKEDQVHHKEADTFFENPAETISLLLDNTEQPTHIVMFDSLLPKISGKLQNFRECFRAFNSHTGRNTEVVAFCKS